MSYSNSPGSDGVEAGHFENMSAPHRAALRTRAIQMLDIFLTVDTESRKGPVQKPANDNERNKLAA